MRSLVLSAIAASFLFISPNVSAQDRYCTGSCDDYVVDDRYLDDAPRLPDESGFGEEYAVGDPVYIDEPQYRPRRAAHPRYKKRRYRDHGHKRRYRETYQQPVYDDITAGRTEFCRETVEKRGHDRFGGWFGKKVKVRRCVWVRNDLVPNHADRGGSWSRY